MTEKHRIMNLVGSTVDNIIEEISEIFSNRIIRDFGYKTITSDYLKSILDDSIVDPSHPDFNENYQEGRCCRFRTQGTSKSKFTYCAKPTATSENGFFCKNCTALKGSRPRENLRKLIETEISIDQLKEENTAYRLSSKSSSNHRNYVPSSKVGERKRIGGMNFSITGKQVNMDIEGCEIVYLEYITNFLIGKRSDDRLLFCGVYEDGCRRINISNAEALAINQRREIAGLDSSIIVGNNGFEAVANTTTSTIDDNGFEDTGILIQQNIPDSLSSL